METAIGLSGIRVSRLGLGCWAFGGGAYWGRQAQQDVDQVVRDALDRGVNFFDTARMYNDGASEKSLGAALRGVRHSAVICSKVSPAKAYPAALRAECEATLATLGSDYVDIYMLHWPINPLGLRHFTDDPAVLAQPPALEEALSTLRDLKAEGKIREIGVSNFGARQLEEALGFCADIVADELPYNLVSRAIEAEIVPACRQNNVALITSMALQQGLLAGRYHRPQDVPPHQAHSRHFAHERGQGTSRHGEEGVEDELFSLVALVRQLAAELDMTVAQVSLAWVLGKEWVGVALAGARNTSQLRENIAAADRALPDAAVARLDGAGEGILRRLGGSPDYYEHSSKSRIY